MQDAPPPAESREPDPTPPPIPGQPPIEIPPPVLMETPKSSAELLAPTVVATAPPPPPPPPAPPAQPAASAEPATAPRVVEKGRWVAVFSHLMLFAAIPTIFLGGVVTFLMWQLLGKDDPFVEDQSREALNFQINVAILSLLLAATFIGLPLVILLWIIAGVISLIAAIHSSRGERYRYPAILRIVTH